MSEAASNRRRPSVDPDAPLTADQLEAASSVEIFDQDGKKSTFGELIQGKRTVAVFIRHFWCGNCKAYVSQLGPCIPPSNLPAGTSLVIIGCGSYQPIAAYIASTHSAYPIYASPSLQLHQIFGFTSKMSGNKAGEEKAYERELGGTVTRIWSSVLGGPARHMEHVTSVGPKGQNGGEIVIEADGRCSFIHRMQNAADHMELPDLARAIGAEHVPQAARSASEQSGRKSSVENVVGIEHPQGGQRVAAA